ncbi:hypothetical protein PG997_008896 [Apiospora hydei]|uniref:Major facilitator superfamily (MFS) profile domain-containing protein n=1 Tax=Apiospora hydei TaxID=1337664 RepID=A0ABR1WG64_9PEZI
MTHHLGLSGLARYNMSKVNPSHLSATVGPRDNMAETSRSSLPVTRQVVYMGITYSLGGFLYGYDTGQISGFLEMDAFKQAFGTLDAETGKYLFSSTRLGLIVGLLSIGNLMGALVAGPLADRLGRKLPITLACLTYGIGAIVQITSQHAWNQVALGRWTGGIGVGALSTFVPLASSESSPTNIRGLVVSGYQMSVTLGILTASLVNLGTETLPSSAAWRITMGLDFVWVTLMLLGLVSFVPESPKYLFATGQRAKATAVIADLMGVDEDHPVLVRELGEMDASLQAERSPRGSTSSWRDMLQNGQIRSRILLATGILSFQQLTGVNFFFYYGTSIFAGTGLSNSYITQSILSLVNVLCTLPGLYFAQRLPRKRCLFLGALWMAVFLALYATTGRYWLDQQSPQRTPIASAILIASTALFIAGFASTWGPLSWGEAALACPAPPRAAAGASLATAVYWLWSFLIAFFTPAVTAQINYAYGYVFGGCCLLMALMVHFCLVESQGRTMEEVDAMPAMTRYALFFVFTSPAASVVARLDSRSLGLEVRGLCAQLVQGQFGYVGQFYREVTPTAGLGGGGAPRRCRVVRLVVVGTVGTVLVPEFLRAGSVRLLREPADNLDGHGHAGTEQGGGDLGSRP